MKNDPPPAGEKPPVPPASGIASAKPSGTETAAVTGQPTSANKLTPEEQMALFEKELKENDWGHQPC